MNDRAMRIAVIALPCALAALVSGLELSNRSLWLDEGASFAIASQHGGALWHAIAHDGGNMLAYYVLLHAVISLFGSAEAVIRLPSVICTVATVGLTCVIARRLFQREPVVLAAGLLCAVSLPLVYWGQDARGYAPMITLCAASFLAFLAIVGNAQRAGSACADVPRVALAGYVVATALACYMGFTAALVIPAQLLFLALGSDRGRGRWRMLVVGVGLVMLCCIPLIVLALRRGSGQLFWVPAPSVQQVGQMLRWLTSAGLPPNFHATATSTITLILLLGALLAAAVAARRSRGALVAVVWVLVPVLLSLLESATGTPILLFRNSVISLPAVALLLGWAVMHPRLPGVLAWTGLTGLIALRALQLAPSYGVSPENWQAAVRYVGGRAGDGAGGRAGDRIASCVAFYPADDRMAFDYYVRRGTGGGGFASGALRPVLPATAWDVVKPYVEDYAVPSAARVRAIAAGCPRLWFVASHQGLVHGPPASRANYSGYLRLRAALQAAYGDRGRTVSYGWADPVRVQRLERSS
ncbi:MAG: glycosyltransferase family 39 protein [Solirubrobacteraceae bacterium]